MSKRKAWALAEKWGFVGSGAEVDEQLVKWVEQEKQRQTAKKQRKKSAKKK